MKRENLDEEDEQSLEHLRKKAKELTPPLVASLIFWLLVIILSVASLLC